MTLTEAKALTSGDYIHHVSLKNADGTPMRARVTSVQTWVRQPDKVIIKFKRGLKEFGTFSERELDQINIGYGEAVKDTDDDD
jgi:hypothetical protein